LLQKAPSSRKDRTVGTPVSAVASNPGSALLWLDKKHIGT
jgi:hypothetical protein